LLSAEFVDLGQVFSHRAFNDFGGLFRRPTSRFNFSYRDSPSAVGDEIRSIQNATISQTDSILRSR